MNSAILRLAGRRATWSLAAALALTILTTALTHPSSGANAARTIQPSDYAALRWRLVGPLRGGRVLAVSGVSGNATLFYFGSVDGGVWKTDDAGRTWTPIFDREPIGSIGAIAVAPSDPRIIYVGSGEADMRSDIAYGNGMYKSTDGGATWQSAGLEDTRQIANILVDPKNPNRVFVAALGHAYGPNAARGVFRSLDGGGTWQKVLFVNEDTGAIDIGMSAARPAVMVAALWQTRRPPWNVYQPSNGPGSGLYRSTDGGTTWHRVSGHGLPSAGLGRMGIAFAPSDPKRAYLIADAKRGGLYRSDNSGLDWRLINRDPRLWDRGWYFCALTVDPNDAATVYVNDTAMYRSTDAGKNFTAIKGSPDGDDFHSLWIDPRASQRLISGSDQGASISLNGGKTWSTWYNQPTAQFYHIATDSAFPFSMYGSQQDTGAAAVLSRSAYSSLTFRDWRAVSVGGESDMLAPDPLASDIVFGGRVDRYDMRTSQDRVADPTLAYPQTLWRETWTLPLVFSPADPHALYFARQMLFRSTDGAQTWKIVSPDLTRSHPGVPSNLDAAAAADNLGAGPRRGVIYSIAPSSLHAGLIWVGTDDGKIWVTRDGGVQWNDVTPHQLTPWSKVTMIEPSHYDAGTAYAAVDRHRLDDLRPYIYRTLDGGTTWQLVVDGIAFSSFVNAIREDPVKRGLLYAATETGVVVSFDAGDRWLPLQLNLPTVSVRDLSVRGDSFAIATHGRSFWALDDIAPLRQMGDALAGTPWLFAPAAAIRVRPGDDQSERLPPEEPAAANPPTGGLIDYELPLTPPRSLQIAVLDMSGRVVREWSSTQKPARPNPAEFPYIPAYLPVVAPPTAHAGLNQFVWNFHVSAVPGASDKANAEGPLAPPGRYTVRLTTGDRVLMQPLTILRDPRISADDADLQAQYDLAVRVQREQALGNETYHAVLRAIGKIAASHTPGAPACVRQLRAAVGVPPPSTPDNSMGYPELDTRSVHYLAGRLGLLAAAIESADTAPSPDDVHAFGILKSALAAGIARVPKSACGIAIR